MRRYLVLENLFLFLLVTGIWALLFGLVHLSLTWSGLIYFPFMILAYPYIFIKLQNRLVDYYMNSGHYDRALTHLNRILKDSRTQISKAVANIDISLVLILRGQYEMALGCLKKIQLPFLKPKTKALVFNNFAYCYLKLGKELDLAKTYSKEALNLYRFPEVLITLSLLSFLENDFVAAAKYLKESYTLSQESIWDKDRATLKQELSRMDKNSV